MQLFKRLISLLLAAALLTGLYVPAAEAASTGLSWKETDRKSTLDMLHRKAENNVEPAHAPTEMVRVSIVLEEKPTVQAGFPTRNIAQNTSAMAYSRQLRQKQDALAQNISAQALNGQKLDVVWNLTLVGNIISANVAYGKIAAIEKVKGVKAVVLENSYAPCVVEREEAAQPRMDTALGMAGSSQVWNIGYTGAGSRIAVIDTGTDIEHQSLNNGAFLYALGLNAQAAGVSYEQYLKDLDLLDEQEISDVLRELNIYERNSSFTASQLYLNEKLPFAVNYVDRNLVVDHMSDLQGEHGSHVAGIAAANRYIPKNDGYAEALTDVKMVGTAPDAQLITMKVFGNAQGPYESDYMSAVEDAIILGCDAVNLSLGSGNAGTGFNPYYADLLAYMTTTDTVVVASCGNSDSWSAASYYGYLYSDDVNLDTVGAPGSYSSFFTVASVENSGGLDNDMEVAGNSVTYYDAGSQGFCDLLSTLDTSGDGSGTEYQYVYINGVGNLEDYDGIDLTGKIVFCARGGLTFLEKANNAVSLGAAAVAICNNTSDMIRMDLTGYSYRNPCILITQEDAAMIVDVSARNVSISGVRYLEGTLTLRENNSHLMSDFSSWGVPGDLSLKPEITAPGGGIYSLHGSNLITGGGHDLYEYMSGTSMAAPAVTGMVALMAQYIREKGLAEQENMQVRTLAQSLLMSTATPIREEASGGNYYSLMKQGAGLARVDLAAAANSYILVDGQPDGKVKAELGDDPNRTGVYEFTFSIHNLSGREENYVLSADVFRQGQFEYQEGSGIFMLDTWTADLPAVSSFTADGKAVTTDRDLSAYDLNGDGTTDSADADYLLEYLLGNESRIFGTADVSGDGTVSTYDAHVLLALLDGGGFVAVPAGGSVTVDVKLTITASGKALLEESYKNGTYVEAFVYAKSVPQEAGESATVHSIPVLAFYGSWSDPSMFDRGTAPEYRNGGAGPVPYLYSLNGFDGNALTISYGKGEEYIFGGNPYTADDTYRPERNAFNNDGKQVLKNQYFTLIRNASDMTLAISNADTGEIYYAQQLGSRESAYYHVNAGRWMNVQSGTALDWRGTDARGNFLPEGTNVEISLMAVPEYYLNADGSYDHEALGKGAYLTTRFTIDNTAPQIKNVELVGDQLRVTAWDNQYVAAAVLVSTTSASVITAESPNQMQENIDITVDLDLSKAFGRNFVVEVYDYAGNYSAWEIILEERPVELPRFTVVNYDNATYYGLDPEGSTMPLITSDRGTVDAVEFVDGYIFEITDGRKLYVASEDDLYNFMYLGNIDPDNAYGIGSFKDLAFNYQDNRLYGLFVNYSDVMGNPVLCTIDTMDGTLEVVGNLPIEAENLAIDGEGNFYSTASRSQVLYTYTLADVRAGRATHLLTRYSDLTGYRTSLAWDHEEQVLYQAFPGKLIRMDVENMAISTVMTHELSQPVGLHIRPETWGDRFAPVDTVDSIVLEGMNTLWVNFTVQLRAQIRPWNVSNPNVTWSSSDTSVAAVDGNGLVRGIRQGSAVITATSVLDPRKSASMTIHVNALNKNLKGVLRDEAGDVWWSQFNTDTLPDYLKLAQAKDNVLLTTAAAAEGTLYASSLDTYQGISTLYTVDPATFDMTKVGDSSIAYTDMAYGPGTGYMFATYFNYIALVDTQSGDYMGVWDWSEGVASDLVGITYYGSEYHTGYQAMMDYFLILDADGNVYLEAFLDSGAEIGYFNGPEYGFVTNMGDPVDYSYFQGFYYDGDSVYWTRFNGNDNIVQLILWDYDNTGIKRTLGYFPEGVWPVGGLYCDAAFSGTRTLADNSLKTASIRSTALLTAIPETDRAAFRDVSAAGGTNGAQTNSTGSYEPDQDRIVVTLTPPYGAANGRMTLRFDATRLKLVSVSGGTEAFAYKHSSGTLELAYASREILSADTAAATLTFEVLEPGEHKLRVLHTEAGDSALSQEEVLTFTADCRHDYRSEVTEPTCTEQGYTTYTCTLCGDSYVSDYTDPVDHVYEDGHCKWCGKVLSYAKFTSISTSLGGNIAMNFYVELSEDLVSDPGAYIQFTFGGKTIHVPLREGVASGNNVYRFACPITSKNMTDEITAQVFNGSGAVGTSKTMSVDTYCNWVIENVKDEKTVNLMKAMLNYGASAQMLFSYRTDDLANAALADADKVFGKVDASAFAHSRVGEEDGIKPVSYTLLLDSETTVRCYFQLTGSKTIDQFTFKVDGIEVTPTYKDGYYYIEKANIAAHRLDDMHTFTCGNITITYGGLSYVNQVMTYYTSGTTFDMASALYAYSKAAESYIG